MSPWRREWKSRVNAEKSKHIPENPSCSERDLNQLGLSDIIDIPTLIPLMENFSALTGMVVAVLDTEGKVLIATGWQDICVKFHRAKPESAAACTESDLYLSSRLKSGEYVDYKCKNKLWDIVTPLYIGSRQVGSIFSGQFFYEEDVVDDAVFLEQAERYGYDKEAYLAALRKVPRFTHDEIARLMDYLVRFTEYISRLCYSNLQLAEETEDRRRAEDLLARTVSEKEMLLKELQHRVKNSLSLVASLLSLNLVELKDEHSRRIFREAADRISSVGMLYEKLRSSPGSDRVDLGKYLSDLVELLKTTYLVNGRGENVYSDFAALDCDLRKAVSLGLIFNELFTNAIKYAIAGEAGGNRRIRVSLLPAGEDSAELVVSDDGPGLPKDFDPEKIGRLRPKDSPSPCCLHRRRPCFSARFGNDRVYPFPSLLAVTALRGCRGRKPAAQARS